MNKIYKSKYINFIKFHPYMNIITFVMFIVLIFLGTWQIFRLQEKNYYIESVTKNLSHPAKQINHLENLHDYTKVEIVGKFMTEKSLWLYRRHPQAKYLDGAYLIIPFKTLSDEIILVTIGWIEESKKESFLKEFDTYNKILKIEALTVKAEKNSILIPQNDYNNKIIFTMDTNDICKNLDIKCSEKFLTILNMNIDVDNYLKITPNMMIKITNHHLEYAVTWFMLATILCLIYIYYVRKVILRDLND